MNHSEQNNNRWFEEIILNTVPSGKVVADFEKWKQDHPKAIDILISQGKLSTSNRGNARVTHVWREIMNSKATKKITIAAVIVVACSIGITYLLLSGPQKPGESEMKIVKIPAALLEMSAEQLLDIHYGKAESPFDSSLVAMAVAKALDKLPATEILALGDRYKGDSGIRGDRGRRSARMSIAHSAPKAATEFVEASDLVVQVRVSEVTLDVNDVKDAIIKRQLNRREHFSAWVKAAVAMEVLGAYPDGAIESEFLLLRPVFRLRQLDFLKADSEYMIALKQTDERAWMLPYGEGVYKVEPNEAVVQGFRAGEMPLDEAWTFIMDCYDVIHNVNEPSKEMLDYWRQRFQSDDLRQCWTALEFFLTLPELPIQQDTLLDAIERHWQVFASDKARKYVYFLVEAFDFLIETANERAAERIWALIETERASTEQFLESAIEGRRDYRSLLAKVLRMIAQNPGPDRRVRIERLFVIVDEMDLSDRNTEKFAPLVAEAIGSIEGEDITQLLLDINADPGSYGIERVLALVNIWQALASRGSEELRQYLETFIADPENTDLKVKHYRGPEGTVGYAKDILKKYKISTPEVISREEKIRTAIAKYKASEIGPRQVIEVMRKHLRSEDKEFVPFIAEMANKMASKNWQVMELITQKIHDPCFVPILREDLEKHVRGPQLSALYACGQEDEAVAIATAYIENWINDPNRLQGDRSTKLNLQRIVRFLGTSGDDSAVAVVEYLAEREVTASMPQLRGAAIMALARLSGEQAVGRLQGFYEQESDIYVRITTALALYYLGDDTGWDLLSYFVSNTERSLPEIEARWHVDIAGGSAFQMPIVTYLRSERTDALLLERIRHGISSGDSHTLGGSFAADYKSEILPVLVDQLSNRDRNTREYAYKHLKKLTGKNFGFRPEKFVGQQEAAIEQWRLYVESYLSEL